MDVFNQFTVGLKKQEELKVEFVESLTEFQLLKKKLKKAQTFLHGGMVNKSKHLYIFMST